MANSVRQVMTANPVILEANTPIREAARAMRDKSIGNVVVQQNGQLYGIVTDRDIVVRAVAEGRDTGNTTLDSVCTKEVTSLSPDQSDDDAVRIMKEKSIRRLPVVENGKVVGIVSLGDLAVEKDAQSALGQNSAASANA